MALEDLASFVAAARHGGLTAASRVLGVPKSTLSRRLARLEEEVGQQLVRRTSRTFRLTEAGEALYRRTAPALLDLDEALQATRDAGAQPAGDLRITAPVDLGGSHVFATWMAEFTSRWPRIRLTVDLSDRLVDLVDEGLDVAVRMHSSPLEDRTSLQMRRLMTADMGLYASRAYLERKGWPRESRELREHDLVRFVSTSGESRWPELEALLDLDASVAEHGIATTSMGFAAAAIEAGAGIGMLPSLVAEGLGEVERVLPDLVFPSPSLSLVWPASRQLSPRVRAFVDFMVSKVAPRRRGT